MLIYIAFLLGAVLTIWFYVCIRYYYGALRGVKGPVPVPIIGSVFEFKDTTSPLTISMKYHKKYGDAFKIMVGAFVGVSLLDNKLVEYFLTNTKQIRKGMNYNFLSNWLHTGLLTSTGRKWHTMRKIITPAFHFNILAQFTNVFNSNAEILVKQLEEEVDKGSTDIYKYITLCALDIICESAMGTSINAQVTKKEHEYVAAVKKMCEIIIYRTMNPLLFFNVFYYLTKSYREERECLKILHKYTDSVIASRKEALKDKPAMEAEDNDVGIKKRVAFLDLLLQSTIDGEPLSDDNIKEEVNTFMFAGHDTTTSAISFALFMIAKHQDVQNKILEEQQTIFRDDPKRVCNTNDLHEMKYLEAVIKETLRLYPSVPFYARQLIGDIKYSEDILFPNFTLIMFSVFSIHRDPRNFPDPEKFDPERFTDGKMQKPYTYIPFSAGPRNCIGQKFAMMEMKTIISKVLWNYELLPVVPEHKLNLVSETTLKSSNGILIRIKRRSLKLFSNEIILYK